MIGNFIGVALRTHQSTCLCVLAKPQQTAFPEYIRSWWRLLGFHVCCAEAARAEDESNDGEDATDKQSVADFSGDSTTSFSENAEADKNAAVAVFEIDCGEI